MSTVAPDRLKPGMVIIAHPVSTKGAKACGEFALLDQKWYVYQLDMKSVVYNIACACRPLAKREYLSWHSARELPVSQV
jgi:hypothetical protein